MGLSEHKLIKGTVFLTLAGFLTRIIGFVYKIYLADLLGAHMLGIYQLIFPVYAICFTIYGAGIQTALSQVIAAAQTRKQGSFHARRLLAAGLCLGLFLSGILSVSVYACADWLALHFVMEPALAPYLRILCILFPFCSTAACINGYYYGIQEARIPSLAQIIEQISRVCFVFLCSFVFSLGSSPKYSCALAVWGLVVGEVTACVYSVWHVLRQTIARPLHPVLPRRTHPIGSKHFIRTLLWLSFSLTLTRLLLSLLHSIESILLPAMLRQYGCSASEALSIYGILTGMTLSFILFPSTITNSFAVLLLPSIARADAAHNTEGLGRSITQTIKYCLLLGFLFTAVFFLFGKQLGLIFFHSPQAGDYLMFLSCICPFLYLSTTLTSVINGMKKTQVTFFFTILTLALKIACLLWIVPFSGIYGYLIGLIFSEILLALLEMVYLRSYIHLDIWHWICQPLLWLCILSLPVRILGQGIAILPLPPSLLLLAQVGLLCLFYPLLLLLFGIISKKDFAG